jgi:homoserine O-acetyltransferase
MTDEPTAHSSTPLSSTPGHLAPDDVGLVTPLDFVLPRPFTFKHGQPLDGLTLRYETYGTLNATRDNAVLICHALSGNHHAAGWHSPTDKKPGWWNNLIGPSKAVDTRRFFVICANVPGGCSGSTGPSSTNPATGEPYGLRFPALTILDMVRAQKLLLDHLGVAELHTVIGGSMGGMTAMLFAIEFPNFTRRLLAMATTAREGAQAIAFNEVGRQAIMQDPGWNHGDYPPNGGPRVGLAIARMMAHITYLSDASMDRKFGRRTIQSRAQSPQLRSELVTPADSVFLNPEPATPNSPPAPAAAAAADFNLPFEVESYLRHQGQTFINRFDANSYLYITRALDQFDLDHAYGSLENAFAPVLAESLVVGFTSDWLFPPEQNRQLALALLRAGKRASYAELSTDLGHDSFLLESEELYGLVRGWIERDQPYVFDYAI